jgi:hypothetical protein
MSDIDITVNADGSLYVRETMDETGERVHYTVGPDEGDHWLTDRGAACHCADHPDENTLTDTSVDSAELKAINAELETLLLQRRLLVDAGPGMADLWTVTRLRPLAPRHTQSSCSSLDDTLG